MENACEEWNNYRICENNSYICIGYDVINGKYTGLVHDVNGVLRIPDYVNYNGTQKTVDVLAMSAFGHSSIRKVYLSSTIHTIKRDAFLYCQQLRHIIFPENTQIKSLGRGSIYGLFAMKSFWIPSTVTELEFQTFGQNDMLHIYYCGQTQFTNAFIQSETISTMIHVSNFYPFDKFGEYQINDHNFDCYYEKFYHEKVTYLEARRILPSIYLFILFVFA